MNQYSGFPIKFYLWTLKFGFHVSLNILLLFPFKTYLAGPLPVFAGTARLAHRPEFASPSSKWRGPHSNKKCSLITRPPGVSVRKL